ncbi:MAG: isochorismatase family protein [Gemmatimonadetes bacterium]|nr:isochorismatase family protein [Gemmatimonadota bacterium]
MNPDALRPGDGLLIVDVQYDFCPGGALPVPDGDRVIPVLNNWIAVASERGIPVYASRDWHPAGHPSFREEGGDWPAHCLQDSAGAQFHSALRLPADAIVITKGTRFDHDQLSAFHDTGLAERVRKDGVRRLWIGGLAQDVCVAASALDARRHGCDVAMIPEGSMPVNPDAAAQCLDVLRAAGVSIPETEA